MLYILLVINFIISGLWCQDIERIIVEQGRPFSFDCQHDESVFFGKQLNEWSEVQEDTAYYSYLKLNFNYLPNENILRVKANVAETKHVGYYTCRKSSWTSAPKSMIYQIIIPDVQSFYWNYVCHGPAGSCERWDDLVDENSSYETVNVLMNQIGDNLGGVSVDRKQELDGSLVVCAKQRTIIRRTSVFNQQLLTCELLTNNRHHSMFSSFIVIKDAIRPDPSVYYNSDLEVNRNNEYFSGYRVSEMRSRRKLSTGKKIAIIIGSIAGGLFLLVLTIVCIVCICRNKNASSNSKTKNSKQYVPVKTTEQPRYKIQKSTQDADTYYEEPTPLSNTTPVFIRS
ncbi:unnamed protein product [Rotaria socialis]|uniref:Ig-like domain-containing protein n=1 Tax=Rotaria socialis TaxID=392032 RepID=A0A817VC69_9BILA|nr:unnamed protein product [Rotaria socialis]CAF3343212.1 unnamed protein product [Rotaria socialis]CAF3429256.1 unnamed protein product [Rotaria socialis]CAF3633942.1 unnamed protein product [Rotaria socialis]